MDVQTAYGILAKQSVYDFGKYYGKDDEALGVGQIYSGVRFPSFNSGDGLFDTREGVVYVMSHECDLSRENERPFNEYSVLCPIISLEDCIEKLSQTMSDERVAGFLNDIGKDTISRVAFFPAIDGNTLPYGGVIYLNQLGHVHTDAFSYENANYVNSLTSYSLRIIDYKMTNHLLRPKSAGIPLAKY